MDILHAQIFVILLVTVPIMGHYLNIGFILFTFSCFLENSMNKRTIDNLCNTGLARYSIPIGWQLVLVYHSQIYKCFLDCSSLKIFIDPVKTFIADNDFGRICFEVILNWNWFTCTLNHDDGEII